MSCTMESNDIVQENVRWSGDFRSQSTDHPGTQGSWSRSIGAMEGGGSRPRGARGVAPSWGFLLRRGRSIGMRQQIKKPDSTK